MFNKNVLTSLNGEKSIPSIKSKCKIKRTSGVQGMRVMIVDDNSMNLKLLKEILSDTGLFITALTNPFDAANIIIKEKFDLFLLDVMMPDMSGFELGEIIRKSEPNSQSLIMFISALSDSENKITGYNLGSAAFIEKPFNIDVVRSLIINALKTKNMNDAEYKTKETFFNMLAHDLKSPVNSEIIALELLLKNPKLSKNEAGKNILSDILGAAKYTKNLLDNILNKYKYDNCKCILSKECTSIKSLIEESIEETNYLTDGKNQRIHLINRLKTEKIMLDYLQIKRTVHNLLSNAIEYAPKNSAIEIDLSENKKYIVFSIKNENRGILIKNPEELFDKFISRAEESKKISSGLGLYISKKIIIAHGGTIKIDTRNPKFVRFVFTLPKSCSGEITDITF